MRKEHSKRSLKIMPLRFLSYFPLSILNRIPPLVPNFVLRRITAHIDSKDLTIFQDLLIYKWKEYRKPTVEVFIFIFGNDRKVCLPKQIAVKGTLEAIYYNWMLSLPFTRYFSSKIIFS